MAFYSHYSSTIIHNKQILFDIFKVIYNCHWLVSSLIVYLVGQLPQNITLTFKISFEWVDSNLVFVILDKCLTMSSIIVGGGSVPSRGDSSPTVSVSGCSILVSGCLIVSVV